MTKTKQLMLAADNLLARLAETGGDWSQLESARNQLSDALHDLKQERADGELARLVKTNETLAERIDLVKAQRVQTQVKLMNSIRNYDSIIENMVRKHAAQRAEILRQQDRRRANGGY